MVEGDNEHPAVLVWVWAGLGLAGINVDLCGLLVLPLLLLRLLVTCTDFRDRLAACNIAEP